MSSALPTWLAVPGRNTGKPGAAEVAIFDMSKRSCLPDVVGNVVTCPDGAWSCANIS